MMHPLNPTNLELCCTCVQYARSPTPRVRGFFPVCRDRAIAPSPSRSRRSRLASTQKNSNLYFKYIVQLSNATQGRRKRLQGWRFGMISYLISYRILRTTQQATPPDIQLQFNVGSTHVLPLPESFRSFFVRSLSPSMAYAWRVLCSFDLSIRCIHLSIHLELHSGGLGALRFPSCHPTSNGDRAFILNCIIRITDAKSLLGLSRLLSCSAAGKRQTSCSTTPNPHIYPDENGRNSTNTETEPR